MQLLSLLHQTSCYTCFGEYWSQYNKCISKYIKHHSNILFKTFICLTLQFWVNIMIRERKITLIFFCFVFVFFLECNNEFTDLGMAYMDYNTFLWGLLSSLVCQRVRYLYHTIYLASVCVCYPFGVTSVVLHYVGLWSRSLKCPWSNTLARIQRIGEEEKSTSIALAQ